MIAPRAGLSAWGAASVSASGDMHGGQVSTLPADNLQALQSQSTGGVGVQEMRSFARNAAILFGVAAVTVAPASVSARAGTAATHVSRSQAALVQSALAEAPQIIAFARSHGTTLVVVNPNGTLKPAATSPAKCHYSPTPNEKGKAGTIGDPHMSTSILKKRKVSSTKVNSFVVCDRKVEELANRTYLYTLAGGKSTQRAFTTTYNDNESVLANQGTYYDCKNSHKTTWDGAAVGVSIEGGKGYAGVGYSPHSYSWDCGT